MSVHVRFLAAPRRHAVVVPRRRPLTVALACALVLALARFAQAAPQWWALDTSPPGTPPTIVLQPSSNLQETVLDVTLHGFYYDLVQQAGQTFVRVQRSERFGDRDLEIRGRPKLPMMAFNVGDLVGVQPQPEPPLPPVVQVLHEVQIPGALIYPYQGVQGDDDPPLPFAWDQAFYMQTSQPYPSARAATQGHLGRFSGLPLIGAECYPFRYVPAAQTLLVTRHFLVTIPHAGPNPPITSAISRRLDRQYQLMVANHPVVTVYRPPQIVRFVGDFLIVTAPDFTDEIAPLAEQKRQRGYAVQVVTTDVTGTTCSAVRDYIADWWAAGDATADRYVLLVGSTFHIATCQDEFGHPSDKMYACIDGTEADATPDPYPEVRLGRLPASFGSDLTKMVDKILAYEDGYPAGTSWLDDVLLVAHRHADDVYPGQYRDNQEAVLTRGYPVQPAFEYADGGAGGTDQQVRDAIDAGRGVVAYRGHGGTGSWSEWNVGLESFDGADLFALNNGDKTPVVFSIACLNNASGIGSIGIAWMNDPERAVAHYGATHGSNRDPNDWLNQALFWYLYDYDVVMLGELLTVAEDWMCTWFPGSGEENAWMYGLYGDPDLEIWREDVPPMTLLGHPVSVPPAPGTVSVSVHRPAGSGPGQAQGESAQGDEPVPFATVALYKAGEFAENRYTDAQGNAQIPIDPSSPGAIEVTVYTELDGSGVLRDTILVEGVAAVPPASGLPSELRLGSAHPNPARTDLGLSFALPRAGHARLSVADVQGRTVATLADGEWPAGEHAARWSGQDRNGVLAPAGLYFLRLEFEGRTRVTRVALAR